MSSIKTFTVRIIALTLVLAGLIYILQNHIQPTWVHDTIWKILSFFALLTWVTGAFVQYLMKISKENSSNILLGATAIRFMASLGFVVIFLLLDIENIILFVVNFFVIYLFYLIFDIYGLIANLRPHSKIGHKNTI
ncbi:hypothetical protein ACFOUP_17690 [Belliella kenyensis]|uniref:ATP synthase protein I n=1 Tax=Belliella kenyensis TaxID=1472724 RepID=A0ABV8ER75_9BACT|nr:hypothetical protein [Belliella kenyensis]MCH7402543.1 hypothetical protein [Belliella kenyensis]MDN3603341.1 hypothetical protein [Belliella kenyensis]